MLRKLSIYLPAALILTLTARHSQAQTASDQTLGISPIAQQVGNRMMPNLYYFYSDPAYKLGATQQGYKTEVVQQIVQAMKGITQPVNAAYGDYNPNMYTYVWALFGFLCFLGLFYSGFALYNGMIRGQKDSTDLLYLGLKIAAAWFMWSTLINAAPQLLISFIDQFTGLSDSYIATKIQQIQQNPGNVNQYMQQIAKGQAPGNISPYMAATAIGYNVLDQSIVAKCIQAIASIVNFQQELGYPPTQAQNWIRDMNALSYQIHIDNSGPSPQSSGTVTHAYGLNLGEVLSYSKNYTVPMSETCTYITNAFNTASGLSSNPTATSEATANQVTTMFKTSQQFASEKFYTQVTNRLRAIANQPMLIVPGVPISDRTPDNWLGVGSSTDMPSGISPQYPDSSTAPAGQTGGSPNNTNPSNTLTAAGMLENAIPQPGEAPPVGLLLQQPKLLENAVNFAMVEIGIAIWSLPLCLMTWTAFLIWPKPFGGPEHMIKAFQLMLTLIVACVIINICIELATMNCATDISQIVQLNQSETNFLEGFLSYIKAGVTGAYDPAVLFYCALIIAALPIATGIVKGSNMLAVAAFSALGASGMSGVNLTNALASGNNNTLAGQAIHTAQSVQNPLVEGAVNAFTGGMGGTLLHNAIDMTGLSNKPKPPSSPSQ